MDSAGPMGKTPYDIAVLLDVIREPGVSSQGNFVSLLEGSWADLSIATVSYKTWWLEEDCLKPVESATKQMVF
jgi:amidase